MHCLVNVCLSMTPQLDRAFITENHIIELRLFFTSSLQPYFLISFTNESTVLFLPSRVSMGLHDGTNGELDFRIFSCESESSCLDVSMSAVTSLRDGEFSLKVRVAVLM